MLNLLIFLFINSLAFADLNCYDCDPSSPGACLHPHKNNIYLISCEGLSMNMFVFEKTVIHECVTIYFEPEEDYDRGVYRGCIDKMQVDTTPSCDYVRSRMPAGNVTYCRGCTQDGCNTETPDLFEGPQEIEEEIVLHAGAKVALPFLIQIVLISVLILFDPVSENVNV